MKIKDSLYLKFIDYGLELASSIPRHFSKFSKKIYNNQQHVVLLVLKQKLKVTYRDLIEWIKINEPVRLMLGLSRVPHHTTLVKFAKRIKPKLLNLLLPFRKAKHVAVDATGFELEEKSYYYRTIWNSNRRQKTRRFMKLSIAVDTDKQRILTYKIRKSRAHDTRDFELLLRDIKADYVLADKGYASRKNRTFVYTIINAIPQIPFKKCSSKSGYYQRKAAKDFNEKIYHQRSKIETIFGVIKKKYGSILRARNITTQKIELITKLIAYNIDRKSILTTLLIRGFQQSR